MAGEDLCPNCGRQIDTPGMFHGSDSMTMHTRRHCPNCNRLLIWFHGSDEFPERWLLDENEEQRRQRAES